MTPEDWQVLKILAASCLIGYVLLQIDGWLSDEGDE